MTMWTNNPPGAPHRVPPIIDSMEGVSFHGIDPQSFHGYGSYLFLDLDRTSCDHTTKRLSTVLMRFLSKLQQRRVVKTILCTGRPVGAARFLARDMGLQTTVIGSNGTAVSYREAHSCGSRVRIQRTPTLPLLQGVLRILRDNHGISLHPMLTHAQATDIMLNQEDIGDLQGLRHILSHDQQILRLTAPLQGVTLTDSLTGIIHLHGSINSKGRAIRSYIQSTGIAKDKTMFAGNGLNDLSAKGQVGKLLAVANAEPQFLAVADRISTHEDCVGTMDNLVAQLTSRQIMTVNQIRKLLDQVQLQVMDQFKAWRVVPGL